MSMTILFEYDLLFLKRENMRVEKNDRNLVFVDNKREEEEESAEGIIILIAKKKKKLVHLSSSSIRQHAIVIIIFLRAEKKYSFEYVLSI